MEIKTDFSVGSKAYYLARVGRVPCWVCSGSGTVQFDKDVSEMNEYPEFSFVNTFHILERNKRTYIHTTCVCPQCSGKKSIKPLYPVFEVREGTVLSIDCSIADKAILTYQVMDAESEKKKVISAQELFASSDVASKVCAYLNLPRIIVDMNQIKVTPDFAATIPATEKLNERLSEYRRGHRCDTEILIRQDKTLIDGYTSYLTYRMFGHKQMPVVVVSDETKSFYQHCQRLAIPYMKRIVRYQHPILHTYKED